MDLDLRLLRRFLAVVDTGSFSAAARELHLTQQALSTSIARLEEQLGVSLFDRSPGGRTEPSLYGRTLVKHARSLLAGEEQAYRDLREIREASAGSVTVGVGEVLAGGLVAEAVARLHKARPDIELSLIEGYSDHMTNRLMSGTVDFVAGAVNHDPKTSRNLVQEHLFDIADVVAARRHHPLAARQSLELTDLQGYTWVVPKFREDEEKVIARTFIAAGLEPPRHFIRSDTLSVGMALFTSQDYLIMAPRAYFGSQFGDQMAILDIAEPSLVRSAGLTYRRDVPLTPAALALMQQIREVALEMAED